MSLLKTIKASSLYANLQSAGAGGKAAVLVARAAQTGAIASSFTVLMRWGGETERRNEPLVCRATLSLVARRKGTYFQLELCDNHTNSSTVTAPTHCISFL
jgi:hypothetical protein